MGGRATMASAARLALPSLSSISSGICLVTAAPQQPKDEDLGRLSLAPPPPPPPPLLAECGPGGRSRRCQKYHSLTENNVIIIKTELKLPTKNIGHAFLMSKKKKGGLFFLKKKKKKKKKK